MSAELATIKQHGIPASLEEAMQYAKLFAESGMFPDVKSMAQCAVKILAGRELGIPAFAAMSGIHIINGKTTLSANLMATLIKRSSRYNFRVVEQTDKVCTIRFTEKGDECGISSFSMQDAQTAGLLGNPSWKKYPRNMLFARALSNGARWFSSDVFGGPVYTPEEMGAEVNEEGEIVLPAAVASAVSPRIEAQEPGTEAGETIEEEVAVPPKESDDAKEARQTFGRIILEGFGVDLKNRKEFPLTEYNAFMGALYGKPFPHHTQATPGDYATAMAPITEYVKAVNDSGGIPNRVRAEADALKYLQVVAPFFKYSETQWRRMAHYTRAEAELSAVGDNPFADEDPAEVMNGEPVAATPGAFQN